MKDHPEMPEDEAWAMARSVVIHGDELAAIHAAEEALDDNEIEKGKKNHGMDKKARSRVCKNHSLPKTSYCGRLLTPRPHCCGHW